MADNLKCKIERMKVLVLCHFDLLGEITSNYSHYVISPLSK